MWNSGMIVRLNSSEMQLFKGSICLTKGNGDVGDTYLLRQQQLQAKLSYAQLVRPSLSYGGAATARCLEASSRCDRRLSYRCRRHSSFNLSYGIRATKWWPVIGCVRLYNGTGRGVA
jgi:hypothetical protein